MGLKIEAIFKGNIALDKIYYIVIQNINIVRLLEVSENSLANVLEDRTSEERAAGQASRYIEMGYKNAKALKGRVTAWKEAGWAIKEEKE